MVQGYLSDLRISDFRMKEECEIGYQWGGSIFAPRNVSPVIRARTTVHVVSERHCLGCTLSPSPGSQSTQFSGDTWKLWWLVLCVNLPGPQSAQVLVKCYSGWFLRGCFWMGWPFFSQLIIIIFFLKPCYWGMVLISPKLHKFNVYNLMSLEMSVYPWSCHTIYAITTSITPKTFLPSHDYYYYYYGHDYVW